MSCPRGLPWRQRHTAHPFSGNHYVAERLRHPDLGREIGLEGKLANQPEIVCGTGLLCLSVDLAQHLLALFLRKRCEVIAAALAAHAAKLLQSIHNMLLLVRLITVSEQQVDRGASACRLRAGRRWS